MIDFGEEVKLGKGDSHRSYHSRKKMLREQILSRGVKDPLVLAAMEAVPRHRFVPESLETEAYSDKPLPIGENQTISQPFIVAYMTAALGLTGNERILEVGAGSGYQTAVLAEIVKKVYTVEINQNLIIDVARRYAKFGYENIELRYGDGYKGWPECAPFDGIVVTAAHEHIPPSLIEQLKVGGKMILPVGEKEQELVLVTKDGIDSFKQESQISVRFVPLLRNT